MKKLAVLGGIVGPILFTVVVIISSSLRTDYNHLHNFISELGATETANDILMNFLGFVPSGLLIGLFGLSLLLFLPKKTMPKIGALLIMVFGLGMAVAGLFSCDAGCPPNGSMESIIHDRVSAVTFISAILGILLLGFSFRKIEMYRGIARYSIVSGIISAILLVTMISSFESKNFTGLWQRLLLLSIFIWTSITAIRTYKVQLPLASD